MALHWSRGVLWPAVYCRAPLPAALPPNRQACCAPDAGLLRRSPPLLLLQVEVITQQITRMFRKCEARLQQFGGEPSTGEADEKVKRNVQVGAAGLSWCGATGNGREGHMRWSCLRSAENAGSRLERCLSRQACSALLPAHRLPSPVACLG